MLEQTILRVSQSIVYQECCTVVYKLQQQFSLQPLLDPSDIVKRGHLSFLR